MQEHANLADLLFTHIQEFVVKKIKAADGTHANKVDGQNSHQRPAQSYERFTKKNDDYTLRPVDV